VVVSALTSSQVCGAIVNPAHPLAAQMLAEGLCVVAKRLQADSAKKKLVSLHEQAMLRAVSTFSFSLFFLSFSFFLFPFSDTVQIPSGKRFYSVASSFRSLDQERMPIYSCPSCGVWKAGHPMLQALPLLTGHARLPDAWTLELGWFTLGGSRCEQ